MEFNVRKNGSFFCFDVDTSKLSANFCSKFKEFLLTIPKSAKNIAINCSKVMDLEFAPLISVLKDYNISLFSLNPAVAMQISVMSPNYFPRVYMSEDDFVSDKRMLVRRRFKIL